jgi:hypothetical protein
VPWIGTIVAIAAVGHAIRRKRFLGGTLDTALDAVPCAAKNLVEVGRAATSFETSACAGSGARIHDRADPPAPRVHGLVHSVRDDTRGDECKDPSPFDQAAKANERPRWCVYQRPAGR